VGRRHPDGALELERLWNGIAERFPFRLLCAYPNRAASDPGAVPVLADVCAVHSRVTGVAPSDEDAERTATFALGPDSAGAARRFVSSVLAEWGLSDLIYDAWLVVTELAANAMAHGRSDFTVGISRASGGLKISVGDAGAGNPRMLEPAPDSAGGRGLGLVAGLAAAWGQVRSPIGKLVWAFLDSPGLTPRSG
jgi:anti-sigma regulatory factor (Ser/Thr protein kinase)